MALRAARSGGWVADYTHNRTLQPLLGDNKEVFDAEINLRYLPGAQGPRLAMGDWHEVCCLLGLPGSDPARLV